MSDDLVVLALTAATIGVVHTLLGPDHYVPFLVLARARGWGLRRTLGVTALCGVGHVSGSVLLGVAGISLGWAATSVAWFESARGEAAGWLLLGFGVAYTAWGLRQAVRGRPHSHWHAHGDGEVHAHAHTHHGEHAHVHADKSVSPTAWALFVVFVLGPCEPLVPLLMIPASRSSWWGVATVTAVFAAATLTTMLAATWLGTIGFEALGLGRIGRYGHALAGLALVACGVTLRLGF